MKRQSPRIELLRARLERYYEAEDAILSAQSYEMEGMRLTRADLEKVQNMIASLEAEISRQEAKQQGGRSRMRIVIPV